MGKKNIAGKLGFFLGLLDAIVFGILFICSVPFTLLMGVGCIGVISEGSGDISVILLMTFFVICCAILGGIATGGIVICILTRRYDTKLRKYLIIIAKERNLESIARTMGKNHDKVKADIKKIIENGHLENAYFDESTDEIIFIASNKSGTNKVSEHLKVVVCPHCGAKNTVSGDICECEFCGTVLK